MKTFATKIVVITMCAGICLACTAMGQDSHNEGSHSQVMQMDHPMGESNGAELTITGYARDAACLLRNPRAGAAVTPVTQDCLEKCIRGGSPIGILSEEGTLYLPISDSSPDKSVRNQLLPYVGKYVKVTGRVYERGTLHAISIEKIEVIKRPVDSKIPTL